MKYITEILLIILTVALLGVSVYGYSAQKQGTKARADAVLYQRMYDGEKAAVEALVKSAALDAKTLKQRAVYAEKLLAQTKKERNDLKQALADNRAWADSPVPASVRSALESN